MNRYILATIVLLAAMSCSKGGVVESKAILESSSEVTLRVGQTSRIRGQNLSNDKLSVRDISILEISDDLVITANKVGHTYIYGPSSIVISVLVTPTSSFSMPMIYNVYGYYDSQYKYVASQQIPYTNGGYYEGLSFGLNISVFKTKMGFTFPGYKLYKSQTTSTMKSLIYSTSNTKTPYLVYTFKNDNLSEAGVLVSMDYINEIPAFLNERYYVDYVDTQNYRAYFSHKSSSYNYNTNTLYVYTDYVGGIAYNSNLNGVLIGFMKP